MLSEEMQIARIGNFTASENHRLMAGWEKPPAKSIHDEPELRALYDYIKPLYLDGEKNFLVGDVKPHVDGVTGDGIKKVKRIIAGEEPPTGLVTYAHEKAEEELYHLDPTLGNWSTVHTRNGEERELECIQLVEDELNVQFDCTGDVQAHIQNDNVGVTPDGVKNDELGLVEWGVEAKCKSPHEHTNLLLITNNDELKSDAFDHFVQCQTGMLVTNAKRWLFVAYNPFGKSSDIKLNYFFVERDNAFIEILVSRINLAKKVKAERLAELTKKFEARAAQKQKVMALVAGNEPQNDDVAEPVKHEAELDLEV